MSQQELEIDVGDTIQIGNHIVTVIDVDGPEVSFRIEGADENGVLSGTDQRSFHPR